MGSRNKGLLSCGIFSHFHPEWKQRSLKLLSETSFYLPNTVVHRLKFGISYPVTVPWINLCCGSVVVAYLEYIIIQV